MKGPKQFVLGFLSLSLFSCAHLGHCRRHSGDKSVLRAYLMKDGLLLGPSPHNSFEAFLGQEFAFTPYISPERHLWLCLEDPSL